MEAPRSGAIELGVVLRFVDIATDALAGAREEIDALNVYPVPDGDTGTNMYLTVSAAREAIREASGRRTRTPTGTPRCAACSRGALLGARGNSGVILSEMLGAVCRRIDAAGADERNAAIMADALRAAADAAYAAVGTPVEGTILTVARAAADAAEQAVAAGRGPGPRRLHRRRGGRPRGPGPHARAAAGAGRGRAWSTPAAAG